MNIVVIIVMIIRLGFEDYGLHRGKKPLKGHSVRGGVMVGTKNQNESLLLSTIKRLSYWKKTSIF